MRQIRIETMHRRAHVADERSGCARSLNDDVQPAERKLTESEIHRRLGGSNERRVLQVADDADDLELRVGRHHQPAHRADEANARDDDLADWILVGPLSPGERIVDDDDARRVDRVARVENATFQQRHADAAEVVFVDGLMLRLRPRQSPTRGCSGTPSGPRHAASNGRKLVALAIVTPGCAAKILQQLIVEVGDLLPVRVRVRQFDARGDRSRRPERRVLGDQALEAAREQRGADEQHDREPDLGDDEHAAGAAPRAARVRAAARVLQRPLHVAARHEQRRHDSERDRRQRRKRARKHAARADRDRRRRRSRGICDRRDAGRAAAPIPPRRATPSAVPSIARMMLSVRNCRTRRPRLAPIAARTATSRSRTVARASSRLATLVQVMTSRNAAAPNSANNAGRKKPTTSCDSGIARACQSPLVALFSTPSRVVSARSSAFA